MYIPHSSKVHYLDCIANLGINLLLLYIDTGNFFKLLTESWVFACIVRVLYKKHQSKLAFFFFLNNGLFCGFRLNSSQIVFSDCLFVQLYVFISPNFSLSSPILGVCVVDSRILGTSMLCLTSKMECIIKPLRWKSLKSMFINPVFLIYLNLSQ